MKRTSIVVLISTFALAACGGPGTDDPIDAGDVGDATDTIEDARPDVGDDSDAAPDGPLDTDTSPDAEPDVAADTAPDSAEPLCGDSRRDDPEQCDDGNTRDGDGCSAMCVSERCGDGVVQPGLGEECDGVPEAPCTALGLLGDGVATCNLRTCTLDRAACEAPACPADADPVCIGDPRADRPGDGCFACSAERCIDGADTDADGLPDCDDVEQCDGRDNDGDGVVDEGDYVGRCDAEPACGLERCGCVDGTLRLVVVEPVAAERCNGRDDDCDGDGDAADCSAPADLDSTGTALRELALTAGPVDLLLLVDRTQSAAAAAESAAAWLAGLAATAPDDLWLGAGGTGDVPGIDGGDGPLSALWFPITGERGVATTLDWTPDRAWRGGASPDGAQLAIYQVATGEAVRWNAAAQRSPDLTPGTIGWLGALDAVDTFVLDAPDATLVEIEAAASQLGSPVDLRLTVRDAGGRLVAGNDDATLLDPRVRLGPGRYVIAVEPCCTAPDGTSPRAWYSLRTTVDGRPYVAAAEACVVEDPEDVALMSTSIAAGSAWPSAADCLALCGGDVPDRVAAAMCGNGRTTGRCGDGRLDWGEVCDDGNLSAGDGCDGFCSRAPGGFAALDPASFARSALFNNRRDTLAFGSGGAGWRAEARRLLLVVGDGLWHNAAALRAVGVTPALGTDEVASALASAGIALGAVHLGGDPTGRTALETLALQSGGWAEPCAFDGSPARASGTCASDACCTGPNGAGRPAVDGRCPLVFDAGTDAEVGAALDRTWAALGAHARSSVSLDLTLRCWVSDIHVVARAGRACGAPPTLLDADAMPGVDTVADVRPGDVLAITLDTTTRDVRDIDADLDTAELCADLADPVSIGVAATTGVERWVLDGATWIAAPP